jgi:hypothetical protein
MKRSYEEGLPSMPLRYRVPIIQLGIVHAHDWVKASVLGLQSILADWVLATHKDSLVCDAAQVGRGPSMRAGAAAPGRVVCPRPCKAGQRSKADDCASRAVSNADVQQVGGGHHTGADLDGQALRCHGLQSDQRRFCENGRSGFVLVDLWPGHPTLVEVVRLIIGHVHDAGCGRQ